MAPKATVILLVLCLIMSGALSGQVLAAGPNDLPDLVVQEITQTSNGKLQVMFANVGMADLTKGWAVAADIYFDQAKMGTLMINNVPSSSTGGGVGYAGGTSTFILWWDITHPVAVTVTVDALSDIAESNEQNNTRVVSLQPPVRVLPDLMVLKVVLGQDNLLLITFANIGDADLPQGWSGSAAVFFGQFKPGSLPLTGQPLAATDAGFCGRRSVHGARQPPGCHR